MDLTNEQVEYLIDLIRNVREAIHSEWCYPGHCECKRFEKALEILTREPRKFKPWFDDEGDDDE